MKIRIITLASFLAISLGTDAHATRPNRKSPSMLVSPDNPSAAKPALVVQFSAIPAPEKERDVKKRRASSPDAITLSSGSHHKEAVYVCANIRSESPLDGVQTRAYGFLPRGKATPVLSAPTGFRPIKSPSPVVCTVTPNKPPRKSPSFTDGLAIERQEIDCPLAAPTYTKASQPAFQKPKPLHHEQEKKGQHSAAQTDLVSEVFSRIPLDDMLTYTDAVERILPGVFKTQSSLPEDLIMKRILLEYAMALPEKETKNNKSYISLVNYLAALGTRGARALQIHGLAYGRIFPQDLDKAHRLARVYAQCGDGQAKSWATQGIIYGKKSNSEPKNNVFASLPLYPKSVFTREVFNLYRYSPPPVRHLVLSKVDARLAHDIILTCADEGDELSADIHTNCLIYGELGFAEDHKRARELNDLRAKHNHPRARERQIRGFTEGSDLYLQDLTAARRMNDSYAAEGDVNAQSRQLVGCLTENYGYTRADLNAILKTLGTTNPSLVEAFNRAAKQGWFE